MVVDILVPLLHYLIEIGLPLTCHT